MMVNESIRIGLANDVSSLRRLSTLGYNKLASYDTPSYYKICSISRAAGILSARKKSLMRGRSTRAPYVFRQQLVCCYGFRIDNNQLDISIARGRRYSIPLNKHVMDTISQQGVKVRSFTLTQTKLTLCVARIAPVVECSSTVGVDCNLRNLTVGSEDQTFQYNLSKTVRIAEATTRIVSSFKRDDARIRARLAGKYGRRRTARTDSILHNITTAIVRVAVRQRNAIVLENIQGIRRLYCKGNGQGRKYRDMMNGWKYGEAQRMIEYKARWVGLPLIRLSRSETRGSSITCPRCGERLQSDKRLKRKLWCQSCRVVMDRDRVAVANLAMRGRAWFARSQPPDIEAKGGTVEAVKENPTTMVISRVDAPKLTQPTKS